MLRISPEQYAALEQDGRDRFLQRSCAFLAGQLERPVDPGQVSALFNEATGHSLASERELVGYALVQLVAALAGDPDRARWTAGIMTGPGAPGERLERLQAFARARVAGR